MQLLAKLIDAIIWLFKPRIIIVDKEQAKFWTTYGGAKLVGKKGT